MTTFAALSVVGMNAMMTIEGGTSAEVFVKWNEKVLVPDVREGAILVMDNLGADKGVRVRAVIEAAGANEAYFPLHSPDLNPIELAWTKVNQWFLTARRRTRAVIDEVLDNIMRLVTRDDAEGWFRHCGYRVHPE